MRITKKSLEKKLGYKIHSFEVREFHNLGNYKAIEIKVQPIISAKFINVTTGFEKPKTTDLTIKQ